jgi:tetratricopeptide (TPR) repeat protein
MTQPLKYETNDPLSMIVNYLEKCNEDKLANDVIDVFAARSNSIEETNLLAKLYLDVRNISKSEQFALRVLGKAGTNEETYNARANLGKLYNNINEPEKSLFHSRLNLMINPKDSDTLLEMVFSLYLLNRKDEAEKILREMKARENELEEKHQDIVNFNLGTYNLEKGHFIEGLKGFMLKGRKLNIWFSPRQLPYKFWDGGEFPGKTLILFAEGGGIGDEMLSVRFMDQLKAIGFRPVFYTSRKDLYTIFNRCGYETVMNLDGIPEDAMWTYFMQVPIYLNSTPESVIASKYLWSSDEAKKKWSFIKDSKKLKIGVRWQGNAKNERDLHRKVPLDDIMKMLHETYQGQDVEYYSLQIGDGVEEMVKYPELIDVSDKIQSYDDTFALLENLDYVVTSCTSVLHASAIVGTKTMALIPISAYFTWVSPAPDNTSIWYPDNLKLFRQVTPKKWDEPLKELSGYLKA